MLQTLNRLLVISVASMGCMLGGACSPDRPPVDPVPIRDARPVPEDPPPPVDEPSDHDDHAAAPVATPEPANPPPTTTPEPSAPTTPSGKKCVVFLHGKGAGAVGSSSEGDVTVVRPGGNADGWGGKQWLYFPDARYQQVRTTVQGAIDGAGCGQVIVKGFSNGAAAAAKLYCRGERFGGKVVGYVVDDPVPDQGVIGCKPASGMKVRLYWTGGLSGATDGWSCAKEDWTCEGGSTIGIAKYGRALGTEVKQSIHTQHAEYSTPPEISAWF